MIEIRTANAKGHMVGNPGDGVVLNFIGKARGVVRYNLSPTIQTDGGGTTGVITMDEKIRKLTERECFRLMGFIDPEIDTLIDAKNEKDRPLFSKRDLYRFAGNSVVVNCFTELLDSVVKDIKNPNPKDRLDFWM